MPIFNMVAHCIFSAEMGIFGHFQHKVNSAVFDCHHSSSTPKSDSTREHKIWLTIGVFTVINEYIQLNIEIRSSRA